MVEEQLVGRDNSIFADELDWTVGGVKKRKNAPLV